MEKKCVFLKHKKNATFVSLQKQRHGMPGNKKKLSKTFKSR